MNIYTEKWTYTPKNEHIHRKTNIYTLLHYVHADQFDCDWKIKFVTPLNVSDFSTQGSGESSIFLF